MESLDLNWQVDEFLNRSSRFKFGSSVTRRDRSGDPVSLPFGYLVLGPSGMSGVIIEQLNSDDHIAFMERATLVQPDDEVGGEVLVSMSAIYFVQQQNKPEDEEEKQERRVSPI
jgi:hypothetical protein